MKVTYGGGFLPTVLDPDALIVRDRKGVICFNVPDQTPSVIRERIQKLGRWMLSMPVENQREFEVTHNVMDGVYTRSLFIPKDSILVGKIHLKGCTNIVAKGDILVLTENGCGRLKAGHVATSQPGIQKLGYAYEDTVFINVFRTDKTDIAEIEKEIACDMQEYEIKELICQ